MMQNKRVIGITGGSGAGKSHISQELRKRGFTVIDADETAHESINKRECVGEISAYFGADTVKDGRIDRKTLGKKVFNDPEKLEMLNKITHKYILSDIADEIKRADGDTVFVDGAVLIESGMPCDLMIGVLADREIRTDRIMRRDGLTKEEAESRIRAQKDDGFYKENCDFTVVNNGGEIDISAILKEI